MTQELSRHQTSDPEPIPDEPIGAEAIPGQPVDAEASSAQTADPDRVIADERRHLDRARTALAQMRAATEAIDETAIAIGEDPATAELGKFGLGKLRATRLASLADNPDVPPFFARTDGDEGALHIGRRHVRDPAREPLVIDWRAPVATAFYRATVADPMGVRLRRRFGFAHGELTSYEDERLDRESGSEVDATESAILREEIERPRYGPMRDIVATIQPDQDEIVRAPLDRDVCVQGSPGTGKTAVGLHRAAYLLFAHADRLRRSRVLVVGPNRAFLGYIGAVLPTLGEVDVIQVTVDELVERIDVRGTDSPAAARLKADTRMAAVLRRAVYGRVVRPDEPLIVTLGSRRFRIPPERLRRYVDDLRRGDVRYAAARERLAALVAADVRRQREAEGGTLTDREAARLARTPTVRATLDTLWPSIEPEALLAELWTDAVTLSAAAQGILEPQEQEPLHWERPPPTLGRAPWTAADAVLLDELAGLLERGSGFGHVVIDEAQDLSGMQARAIGRRAAAGSVTVLGDLAQGTTPWAARSWPEILEPLGHAAAALIHLTKGYRVPVTILQVANQLLPAIAPDLAPATSVRAGGEPVRRVAADEPIERTIAECVLEMADRAGSVGVITADAAVSAVSAGLHAAGIDHLAIDAETERDEPRVTLVPATVAKGLEFDHVILAGPDAIASGPRGVNRLYVALTRAVTSLTIIDGSDAVTDGTRR